MAAGYCGSFVLMFLSSRKFPSWRKVQFFEMSEALWGIEKAATGVAA